MRMNFTVKSSSKRIKETVLKMSSLKKRPSRMDRLAMVADLSKRSVMVFSWGAIASAAAWASASGAASATGIRVASSFSLDHRPC